MNIRKNISLKSYNTFGMDCNASAMLEIEHISHLEEYASSSYKGMFPELILGGGSNILLTKNFEGIVLLNKIKGIEKVEEDSEHVIVKAGAGEVWNSFVTYCVERNWGGVENLSLIPGTVGASPIQNIGAYGVELKDVFESLDAFDMTTSGIVRMSASDCDFGYRNSVFKNIYKGKYLILSVHFKLKKSPEFNTSYGAINDELKVMGITELSTKAISDAVCNIRRSKLPDPAVTGNAGSFFKNPEVSEDKFNELKQKFPAIVSYPVANSTHRKLAAGWMIEQCGWKGKTIGKIGVHPQQALVLVNYGGGSGKEIYNLSERIKDSVLNTYGVILETEVNII